jgi:hypothetical protein
MLEIVFTGRIRSCFTGYSSKAIIQTGYFTEQNSKRVFLRNKRPKTVKVSEVFRMFGEFHDLYRLFLCIYVSYHQNAGQSHNLIIDKSLKNVASFIFLETAVTV